MRPRFHWGQSDVACVCSAIHWLPPAFIDCTCMQVSELVRYAVTRFGLGGLAEAFGDRSEKGGAGDAVLRAQVVVADGGEG